jgi:hypothetical protein
MKVKKAIAAVVAVCVVAGAVVGGIYGYKSYQDGQLVAEVQLVSDISWGYWGDSETSYGMVTNDSSQEIYLADAKTIKQVYVQEGDIVEVGDPLIEYDTTEVRIEIQRQKLSIEAIENDIETAAHTLEVMQNATPVDKTPPKLDTSTLEQLERQDEEQSNTPERDTVDSRIYNYVTAGAIPSNVTTNAATGELEYPAGTADDPYIYYCNPDAYVYGSFFNSIRGTTAAGNGKYVEFYVCLKDEKGKMVTSPVAVTDENGVPVTDVQGNVVTEEKPVLNATVSPNKVTYDGNNIPADYEEDQMWYIFTGEPYVQTSLVEDYMDKFMENATDWEEPEGYTEEELVKGIAEQQNKLKELDIRKRQAELQLESLQNTASDGILYAEIAGEVKTVGDPDEYQSDGTAFLVVTGEDGLYVRGTISELLLDEIQPGTIVTANSWESGMTFDATITEISDYPVSGNSWGDGNPNVSYYSYTAYIEDSSSLRNGEYVDLSIETNQTGTEGIYLEKAYVRTEDGKSYCMIADENDRLKKQYVVTGRTIYGSAVEIKAGLTMDDRIAFPYGKNAVEGAAVTEAENYYYYY